MNMARWIVSFLFLLTVGAALISAQEVVATKDGKYVLLKSDGTWVYLREESPTSGTHSSGSAKATDKPQPEYPNKLNLGATGKERPTLSSKGNDTGEKTATGKTIYEGPRGGRYHYSASGRKVYEKRK